jgi:phage gp36-like protein
VPLLLTRIACDLARFNLYTDAVTDVVKLRYERAVALLRDLASGKTSLGLPEPPPAAESAGVIAVRAPARIFGPDLDY